MRSLCKIKKIFDSEHRLTVPAAMPQNLKK